MQSVRLQILRVCIVLEEIERRHHKIIYPDLQLAYFAHRQVPEVKAVD